MAARTIDFGIDLGTTNSSIACCRNAQVKIFQTTELMSVTPSVVYIASSGRMLVGRRAYDAWINDPENTHAEFKRWIGFSDKLLFPASNRQLTAEELSAEILKSLRADVQRIAGESVDVAVITVPAAFGALQCEATARAAKLAGFVEAPLLQEPIAAAIAYGASATGAAQRWLVFDLGGGTLDVAVVSTRNGRLAVLEHQGNNRLGGKDMDRIIAEKLLLPLLSPQFKLPDRKLQPTQYDRFFRNLLRVAEHAKITLTTAAAAPVELFNIGSDLAGAPIEASLELSRGDLEASIQPLVDQCLELVASALSGARMMAGEIDRVILVGGPTQMPVIRAALVAMMGNKLDSSIDPMTVVAQGAALYASTLEHPQAAFAAAASSTSEPADPAAVMLELLHERASGTPQSPVAGTLKGPGKEMVEAIRIDADGGFWSSGWIPVIADRFAAEAMLAPGKAATHYRLSAHNRLGAPVPLSPAEFSITYMLPMGSIPLPHTIAIELASDSGAERFDPIFKRHTPLPAEARKTYRAQRTLRPSDHNESLPIKFWEIEVSEDASEKWWAGCIQFLADNLRRPLLEGAEIALTFRIDKSRKMTVEGFMPSINQGFKHEVYVPDAPTARGQLQAQLDLCFERISRIFQLIYAAGRDELAEESQLIQVKLEAIAERMADEPQRENSDPDTMLANNELLRKLRLMMTQLEKQLESERAASPLIMSLRRDQRYTRNVVDRYGKDADRAAYDALAEQLERYITNNDHRGMKYVEQQMLELRKSILVNQRAHYEEWRESFNGPGCTFLNQDEAKKHLQAANDASARDDFPALRDAIHNLHSLRAPDQLDIAEDQKRRSGLKDS